jgi:hypothetical protein
MGGDTPKKGGQRVNTHLTALWIVFAAAAAVALFLVVHAAADALSQTSSLLAGT